MLTTKFGTEAFPGSGFSLVMFACSWSGWLIFATIAQPGLCLGQNSMASPHIRPGFLVKMKPLLGLCSARIGFGLPLGNPETDRVRGDWRIFSESFPRIGSLTQGDPSTVVVRSLQTRDTGKRRL